MREMIKKNRKYFSISSISFNLLFLTLILTINLSCNADNYDSIDITYTNTRDGIKLSGTLTIPKGSRKYPAVLLIQGSGPHNRDEEIFGHKPFQTIADYLSSKGIAVLRVDRRGCGKSEGLYLDLDMDNYVKDALYGIEFLKSYPNIDKNKIGVIGHSLGGLIGAITSSSTNDISFLISLAGPGIWGKDIVFSQNKLWAECSGAKPEDFADIKKLSYRFYDLITKDALTKEEENEFPIIYNKLSYYLRDDIRKLFYPGPADKALFIFRSQQYQKSLKINPSSVWSNVHCPVLALNGSRDFQASADENLSGIENSLRSGKNFRYKIMKLDSHNHLFQRTENGSPAEIAKINESFSPMALEIMLKWIDSLKISGN